MSTFSTTDVTYSDPIANRIYTRPLLVGYGVTTSQAYAARAIAALVASTATAPFHVVQTLAQVGSKEGRKSYATIIEDLWNKEGITAFFKGSLVGALRFGETALVNYLVYYGLKKLLGDVDGVLTERNHQIVNAASIILSSILTYPLEVIRTRLVLDFNFKKYNGALDCLNKTLNTEGWGALFNGAVVSAVGNYAMIEIMERIWLPIRVGLKIFPAGDAVVQSILSQVLYYPIDTVLKMVQAPSAYKSLHSDTPFDGVVDAATSTVAKHGLFSLWRGFLVSVVQAVPYIAVTSLAYNGVINGFEQANVNVTTVRPVGIATAVKTDKVIPGSTRIVAASQL